MKKYIKKNIKYIIIAVIGLILIFSGLISWNLHFSKFQIFHDQEEMFLESVKRFYSMNSNHLPKTGEIREKTLQDLYNGNHIEDLVIPKTNKLCDNNSWVRVYKNDKGEYEYNVYLECGSFKSDTDSLGPEVVLNGEDDIFISVGSKYNELGVKEVVDNVDGNIDIKKVIIDSSTVNTKKEGTYEVKYTIYDNLHNKTVKVRKVNVVRNLTEVVKNATDKTNYYRGDKTNNYILYSGILWKIVNVNSDGSVKIITDEAVTNLRADYEKYKDSNIDKWLNNVFYKNLNNTNEYLVDSTYCVGSVNSALDYSTECSDKITSKIGLLSIGEYKKTLKNDFTSLYSNNFMLGNKAGANFLEAPYTDDGVTTQLLPAIRPVVTLKSNLYLISGDGSLEKPYKLDDYDYGKKNELINNRLVGEYLEYSGLKFRIIGIDKNKNVRIISASPWTIQPNNQKLELDISNIKNFKFDVNKNNNPGYVLNNTYTDYINMKYVVDTEYEVPFNERDKDYDEYEKEKVKAKLLFPKTYELFSSSGHYDNNRGTMYLYIDRTTNDEFFYAINGQNGKIFELNNELFSSYDIKVVLTIKGDLKITKGNGTIYNPYGLN